MKKLTTIILTGAMMCSFSAIVSAGNHMVDIDFWNANLDQPSMGNISTDNNSFALYNDETNILQIATNPVEISGYKSGIKAVSYDTTGNGDYEDVKVLSKESIQSGTKFDGEDHTVEYLSSFEIELPAYLTKEGVEYIPVKIQVPYTPMDTVIGDGYLDSKIRIDWNNISETEIEIIVPNTEISSGEVREIFLESEGITVTADTNSLSEVTKLEVSKITSGEEYELAKKSLDGETNIDLYKVEFKLADQTVAPTGVVNISFPYEKVEAFYRINEDGTKSQLTGIQSETEYTIATRTIAFFAVVGGEIYQEETIEDRFADVTGHWAKDYIEQSVNKGLFNGTSETAFSPNAQMTNAMAITVLYRIAGEPEIATTENLWYSKAIAWGLENGIIGGYTEFYLNENVTREALATMIYKYELTKNIQLSGNDLSQYSDSTDISSWATEGLAWANAQGIVTGKTDTTLVPKASATRAEVATMFIRYIG